MEMGVEMTMEGSVFRAPVADPEVLRVHHFQRGRVSVQPGS